MFASGAAALFGLLALVVLLHSRGQVPGLAGAPAPAVRSAPPMPPDAYTSEGFEFLWKKRQFASAIASFEACLRDYPDHSDAYHGLALAQREAGDPSKAMANHDRAIELDPDRFDLYWERGVTRQRLNDHEGAIADFEACAERNNRFSNPHIGLGQSYRALGKPEDALRHNNQAIALDPRSDWCYRERGFTYQALGDRDRAEADFAKAKELETKAR